MEGKDPGLAEESLRAAAAINAQGPNGNGQAQMMQ